MAVCMDAVCKFFGCSLTKLKTAALTDPTVIPMHHNIGNQFAAKTTVSDTLYSWLTDFLEGLGDYYQPDTGKLQHDAGAIHSCDAERFNPVWFSCGKLYGFLW